MCKYGDQIGIRITRHISVDRCLVQEILFLNDQGVRTINCCCGHGDSKLIRNIVIWSIDEQKAIAMGYEPKSMESYGFEPDIMAMVIEPKSTCENKS